LKPIIDGHCDALYKLWKNERLNFNELSGDLHVSLPELRQSGVALQSFALYIPPTVPRPQMFYETLKCIQIFYQQVIRNEEELYVIQKADDLNRIGQGKIGALLTLEGLDPVIGDSLYLQTLYRLGVRSIGFTWNQANLAADGVGESRGGGLTDWGKEVVGLCNSLGMMLDVSHLSENGFWQMMELSSKPLMASHSNVYDLCPHPRNLKADQIEALIGSDGMIGVTFVPMFVHPTNPSIDVLLRHIEYICERGGADRLGLGSDFDGITTTLEGLESSGRYPNLVDRLLKLYPESIVEGICYKNWLKFYDQQLPK
jgi:membrane dipeptidase